MININYKTKKPKILLLYNFASRGASTIMDHVNALSTATNLSVYPLNCFGNVPGPFMLDSFDGVVIHYSLVMCSDSYLSCKARDKLKQYKGLKACFIQDEYRFINQTIEVMRYMGIQIVFTCVPPSEFNKVYSSEKIPGLKCINVLTGYVPQNLKTIKSIPTYEERKIDIGYRARPIPFWLGELSQEKQRIAEYFLNIQHGYSLKTDISYREEDRIYGKKWINFLQSCKAFLGTESGASVFDFTGEIQANVDQYVTRFPKASFQEVQALFFKDLEGKIKLNQISPRIFEAAALKTLLILYEGEYSNILQPWRHYIPLKKNHSNIDEVICALKDIPRACEIIENAYNDLIVNPSYSYSVLTSLFEKVILSNVKLNKLEVRHNDGILNVYTCIWKKYVFFFILKSAFKEWSYYFLFGVILKNVSSRRRENIKRIIKRLILRKAV
jgi:hypothetical protein